MSQHDGYIADQQGGPFLDELNQALAAQRSQNSGDTAPAPTVGYLFWADTANDMMKMRNPANNGWIDLWRLSTAGMPSVQKQTATAFTTTGTSTAYLLTPLPAISANSAGLRFRVSFHTPPGANATMAVSGQAALPLKYKDRDGVKQAVASTQIPANWTSDVECDGTDWIVLDTPPFTLRIGDMTPLDGSGSGLDADLLDGQHGSYYANIFDAYSKIGCFALCAVVNGGSPVGGEAVAGSYLKYVKFVNGALTLGGNALPGTWRNISDMSLLTDRDVGIFQRVA